MVVIFVVLVILSNTLSDSVDLIFNQFFGIIWFDLFLVIYKIWIGFGLNFMVEDVGKDLLLVSVKQKDLN